MGLDLRGVRPDTDRRADPFRGPPRRPGSQPLRDGSPPVSAGGTGRGWKGKPQNVAYIAAEETAKYVLKPALRAAGADMGRIVTPKVKTAEGKYVALLADEDERAMTEYLVKNKVSVIIVDPVMATIKSKTDIYRSNELRQALDPVDSDRGGHRRDRHRHRPLHQGDDR